MTGGAGFIGSHLIHALLERGIHVVSLDDYSAGHRTNLEAARSLPHFTEVVGDITDPMAIRRAMTGVDTVFNQAASKKTVCMRDPSRDLEVNGAGTLRLLQCAVELGVEKFVHASTGSVYGEPVTFPQTETHPLRPVSYYGVSKLAGESYVNTFTHLFGIDTTALRYFHVYGPRQESSDVGGVVSIFLKRALQGLPLIIHGDGKQTRSFTWVGDVVEANIRAATYGISKGKTYNCASGIRVTIHDLAAKVLERIGKAVPVEHAGSVLGDIREFDVDHSLIVAELGMQFETDFDRGLGHTLDWAMSALEAGLIK
ncbi:MAG: NAD-dependent epimerase/dehydratase family protein [Vicinamibacterales bacterium]